MNSWVFWPPLLTCAQRLRGVSTFTGITVVGVAQDEALGLLPNPHYQLNSHTFQQTESERCMGR